MSDENKKILVICAHPDDEVLGCGGVIQKHVERGDSVEVLIATIASSEWSDEYRANKIEEQKKVDKLLDIEMRWFLDFEVLSLNKIGMGKFNRAFSMIIKEVNPDVIYTHFNKELNEEHNLVSLATLVGTRVPNKATIYMYEYPHTRDSLEPFVPNYFVELSETHLYRKIEAFKIYWSEVKSPPHPRSLLGVQDLACYRGDQIGVLYAEAFKQIRRVW